MRLVLGCLLLGFFLLTSAVPNRVLAAPSITDGLTVSVSPPQASAEAVLQLPSVYVLPGSFWYWFKHLWEEVRLLATIDEEKRAQLLLQFSQERLSEGYQAVKEGKVQSAVASLSQYQLQQQQLANSLDQLQIQKFDVSPFLVRLRQQLGMQEALRQFTDQQKSPEMQKVSLLLEVQPIQMLAFELDNRRVLLGVRTSKKAIQASSAAQASVSAQATVSAQPSHDGELKP